MNQGKLKKVLEKAEENVACAIEMLYKEVLLEKKEISEKDWQKIEEILEIVCKKEPAENKGYYLNWITNMLERKNREIGKRIERLKIIKEKAV